MSDYNAYGSFSEGGFNTDNNNGFQTDGNGSQKPALRTSLTPVTLKQINDATQPVPDGDFAVGGVELNMVSFIGVLRRVNNAGSNIGLSLEDGSGLIEVRKWIDDSQTTANEEQDKYNAMLNKYVAVTGSLKDFNGKKTLQNAVVREISDHNEILYHNLSAIYLHLKSQGFQPKDSKSDSLFVPADDTNSSITSRIVALIKENTNRMQEGVHVRYLATQLNVPEETITEHCNNLIDSGTIYTGYDEHAYLAV